MRIMMLRVRHHLGPNRISDAGCFRSAMTTTKTTTNVVSRHGGAHSPSRFTRSIRIPTTPRMRSMIPNRRQPAPLLPSRPRPRLSTNPQFNNSLRIIRTRPNNFRWAAISSPSYRDNQIDRQSTSLTAISKTKHQHQHDHGRFIRTQWRFFSFSNKNTTATTTQSQSSPPLKPKPLPKQILFQYLKLETFSQDELEARFEQIRQHGPSSTEPTKLPPPSASSSSLPSSTTPLSQVAATLDEETDDDDNDDEPVIGLPQIRAYLAQRMEEIETQQQSSLMEQGDENDSDQNDTNIQAQRLEFYQVESQRVWNCLLSNLKPNKKKIKSKTTTTPITTATTTPPPQEEEVVRMSKLEFCDTIRSLAKTVDVPRTWPITASMVLVGSSAGVITPAMPFVVEQLSLSASQYGFVVAAFALAKTATNIPSAIAFERHGRKPYMVHSLWLIALGVGGIGWASSFEELFTCRLITGMGVSLLSGAATLMVTDLSTPLNRASTMAPIMSGFAAGTALGPALGGIMVDHLGLNPTFYVVGVSFLGVAALNRIILQETKPPSHFPFPWNQEPKKMKKKKSTETNNVSNATTTAAVVEATTTETNKTNSLQSQTRSLTQDTKNAFGQWIPLLRQRHVQSILLMNGFYWLALAGGQMTLLPLILTNELHMTASEVGQAYMGMSMVQIVGNPVFAKFIDNVGKVPAITAGCTLICLPMAALPLVTTPGADVVVAGSGVAAAGWWPLAAVLGTWAAGSSMLSTAPVAYLSDHVQEHERAQAIALLRTCGDVGFLIGASAIGALAQMTDTAYAIQASAGLLFTATTWFGARQLLTTQAAAAVSSATTTPPPPTKATTTTTTTTTTDSQPTKSDTNYPMKR